MRIELDKLRMLSINGTPGRMRHATPPCSMSRRGRRRGSAVCSQLPNQDNKIVDTTTAKGRLGKIQFSASPPQRKYSCIEGRAAVSALLRTRTDRPLGSDGSSRRGPSAGSQPPKCVTKLFLPYAHTKPCLSTVAACRRGES